MDSSERALKFENLVCSERAAHLERRIKTEIRKSSLNMPVLKDVERYSDRHFVSQLVSDDCVEKILSIELLSPELIRAFGGKREKKIEDIKDVESPSEDEEEEASRETEEVDNDYVATFYEEDDELTTEKNEEGYMF